MKKTLAHDKSLLKVTIERDTYRDILLELVERWKCTSYSQYDGPFVTQLAIKAANALGEIKDE